MAHFFEGQQSWSTHFKNKTFAYEDPGYPDENFKIIFRNTINDVLIKQTIEYAQIHENDKSFWRRYDKKPISLEDVMYRRCTNIQLIDEFTIKFAWKMTDIYDCEEPFETRKCRFQYFIRLRPGNPQEVEFFREVRIDCQGRTLSSHVVEGNKRKYRYVNGQSGFHPAKFFLEPTDHHEHFSTPAQVTSFVGVEDLINNQRDSGRFSDQDSDVVSNAAACSCSEKVEHMSNLLDKKQHQLNQQQRQIGDLQQQLDKQQQQRISDRRRNLELERRIAKLERLLVNDQREQSERKDPEDQPEAPAKWPKAIGPWEVEED